ncbi:hypothetical protein BH11BAC5_BH11BAC5_14980 [soil metagenome]|jgi:hypothetical protein
MTTVVKEINKYVNMLLPEEQEQLAVALKKQVILTEAERLSSFVPRKKFSPDEVVKQIRISRKKKYAAKNSN